MEITSCSRCQSPMIYVSLKDPDVHFELDLIVKKVYNKDINVSDYWEGWYCFICGLSEIRPVELIEDDIALLLNKKFS